MTTRVSSDFQKQVLTLTSQPHLELSTEKFVREFRKLAMVADDASFQLVLSKADNLFYL